MHKTCDDMYSNERKWALEKKMLKYICFFIYKPNACNPLKIN